jgi:hypothetical protein
VVVETCPDKGVYNAACMIYEIHEAMVIVLELLEMNLVRGPPRQRKKTYLEKHRNANSNCGK